MNKSDMQDADKGTVVISALEESLKKAQTGVEFASIDKFAEEITNCDTNDGAQQAGKVRNKDSAGSILTIGDVITSLGLADPSKVVKICRVRACVCVRSPPLHFPPHFSHALVSVRAPRLRFLSRSPTRAPLSLTRCSDSGDKQATSMIIVAAAHVKDEDTNPKLQAANKRPHDIPKTQCIRTSPLLEVDGNRCMLSFAFAHALSATA
jgi:hypothetical protein